LSYLLQANLPAYSFTPNNVYIYEHLTFLQDTLFLVQYQGLPAAVTTLQRAAQLPAAIIGTWRLTRPSPDFYEVRVLLSFRHLHTIHKEEGYDIFLTIYRPPWLQGDSQDYLGDEPSSQAMLPSAQVRNTLWHLGR
jgi:hypothetical protein